MNTRTVSAALLLALAATAFGFGQAFAQKNIILRAPTTGVFKAPPSPVAPPVYRFTIDSFVIKETRSLHEDTDTVVVELAGPGNKPPRKDKSMGDVNNGSHAVGLSFDAALVLPQYVDLKYTIFNQGSGLLEQTMNDSPLGLLVIPGIAFADCDGVVAAGQHHFTAIELAQQTANGQVVSGQDYSPGTDSPNGCGSNSKYYVNWSVRRL